MLLVLGSTLSLAFGVLEVPEEGELGTGVCTGHNCTDQCLTASQFWVHENPGTSTSRCICDRNNVEEWTRPLSTNRCTPHTRRYPWHHCMHHGALHRGALHHGALHHCSCTAQLSPKTPENVRTQESASGHFSCPTCNRCSTCSAYRCARHQLRCTVPELYRGCTGLNVPETRPAHAPVAVSDGSPIALPLPDLIADLVPPRRQVAPSPSNENSAARSDSTHRSPPRNVASKEESVPSLLPANFPQSAEVSKESLPSVASSLHKRSGRETSSLSESPACTNFPSARNVSLNKSLASGNTTSARAFQECISAIDNYDFAPAPSDFLMAASNTSCGGNASGSKFEAKYSNCHGKYKRKDGGRENEIISVNNVVHKNEEHGIEIDHKNYGPGCQYAEASSIAEDDGVIRKECQNLEELQAKCHGNYDVRSEIQSHGSSDRSNSAVTYQNTGYSPGCNPLLKNGEHFTHHNEDTVHRKEHTENTEDPNKRSVLKNSTRISSFEDNDHTSWMMLSVNESEASAKTKNQECNRLSCRISGYGKLNLLRCPVKFREGMYGFDKNTSNKDALVRECICFDSFYERVGERRALVTQSKILAAEWRNYERENFEFIAEEGCHPENSYAITSSRVSPNPLKPITEISPTQNKFYFSHERSEICCRTCVRHEGRCSFLPVEHPVSHSKPQLGILGCRRSDSWHLHSHVGGCSQQQVSLKLIGAELRNVADEFNDNTKFQKKVRGESWFSLASAALLNFRSALIFRLWRADSARQLD